MLVPRAAFGPVRAPAMPIEMLLHLALPSPAGSAADEPPAAVTFLPDASTCTSGWMDRLLEAEPAARRARGAAPAAARALRGTAGQHEAGGHDERHAREPRCRSAHVCYLLVGRGTASVPTPERRVGTQGRPVAFPWSFHFTRKRITSRDPEGHDAITPSTRVTTMVGVNRPGRDACYRRVTSDRCGVARASVLGTGLGTNRTPRAGRCPRAVHGVNSRPIRDEPGDSTAGAQRCRRSLTCRKTFRTVVHNAVHQLCTAAPPWLHRGVDGGR